LRPDEIHALDKARNVKRRAADGKRNAGQHPLAQAVEQVGHPRPDQPGLRQRNQHLRLGRVGIQQQPRLISRLRVGGRQHARAAVQAHADRVAGKIGSEQIKVAVVVYVGHRNPIGFTTNCDISTAAENATSVVDLHTHRIAKNIRSKNIYIPVNVGRPDSKKNWLLEHRKPKLNSDKPLFQLPPIRVDNPIRVIFVAVAQTLLLYMLSIELYFAT